MTQKDAAGSFKKNLSLNATVAANNTTPPQSTIFDVAQKSLVIIDAQDIHESTCNERVRIVQPGSHHQHHHNLAQAHKHQQHHLDPDDKEPPPQPPSKYSDMAAGMSKPPTAELAAAVPTHLGQSPAMYGDENRSEGTFFGSSEEFPALNSRGRGRKSVGPNGNIYSSSSGFNNNQADLPELLGNNWPDATTWSESLNNPSPYSSSNTGAHAAQPKQRNRSANPLSHLGGGGRGQQHQRPRSDANEAGLTQQQQQQHQQMANKSTKKFAGLSDPTYDNVLLNSVNALSVAAPEPLPENLTHIPDTHLEVGSMIEVTTDVLDVIFGVIRWIGQPEGHRQPLVGVELERELFDSPLDATDGMYHGHRLFHCAPARGVFVSADQCAADTRFDDPAEHHAAGWTVEDMTGAAGGVKNTDEVRKQFGNVECPMVEGCIAPMSIMSYTELKEICGSFRGIQGHHNSCYLDATLFGMFAFSRVFDGVLYREANEADIDDYRRIQSVLHTEIVNPLRAANFVRADRVLKLRKMLEDVCSVKGLTSEEKDPEEFLNILLAEALKAEPFLQLNTGQAAFCYQLFVDRDDRLHFPSVQQLFDQSFLACNLKLTSVPSCLIVQMPRFGKDYKMYSRILPSQVLDVTDVIENSPRQCCVCGELAHLECKDCFDLQQDGPLEQITYCHRCWTIKHEQKPAATGHRPRQLSVPAAFPSGIEVQRIYMDLFAVVCIETSHYVSFVKTGSGEGAPWCFFDSMADRQGAQNGCNIPQLVAVDDLPEWISKEGAKELDERAPGDKQLPKLAKRLLCDAYLCMYQSQTMLMYK